MYKEKTAGRKLENKEVTAIHRYAVAMGLVFKEVRLEEAVAASGGVEKYSKMTAAEAQKDYDDNTFATPARQPVMYPILQHSKVQSVRDRVVASITQTRSI